MPKVTYFTATSLDGFIADENSSLDWLFETPHGDDEIWLVGGGDLVGQFDDAGLLDEVVAGICPVTLGAGAPLLPRRITSKRMRVIDVLQTGEQVQIRYRIARP